MRYAIISDIHANLEALNVVSAKIDELKPDKVVCLGDLVGYYCNPNEVVQWMIDREAICIMGNHDVVACGLVEPVYFNPSAARAILWTREQLDEQSSTFIRDLPDFRLVNDAFYMVHGSVADRDEYLLFRPEIEYSFQIIRSESDKPQVAFFGHTHRRIYYEFDDSNLYQGREMNLDIRDDTAYLINPGSVGQPRDGDPRASFCLYDTEAKKVDFFRLDYNIDGTAEKVGKLPFGEGLAKRLYRGA